MFDNIKADISRFHDNDSLSIRSIIRGMLSQGFQAILVYRFFRWFYLHRIPTQPIRFFFERFIEIVTGISIPVQCKIGKGLRIHHFGGIIFHPSTVIGEFCTIYHGVTIGDKGGYGNAAIIEDFVMLGAGAKIIGEINVGSYSKIGANTVVNKNIPAYSVVVGNPGKIIKNTQHASTNLVSVMK